MLSGVATWARPPAVTARAAATVDAFAGGRYVLGLGTMPAAWNADHCQIDPTQPLDRLREHAAGSRKTSIDACR